MERRERRSKSRDLPFVPPVAVEEEEDISEGEQEQMRKVGLGFRVQSLGLRAEVRVEGRRRRTSVKGRANAQGLVAVACSEWRAGGVGAEGGEGGGSERDVV
jgi:hypothetical protein